MSKNVEQLSEPMLLGLQVSPGCLILNLRNAIIQAKSRLKLFWVLKSYVKKKKTATI